jgi:biopolymer transport protein ExbD
MSTAPVVENDTSADDEYFFAKRRKHVEGGISGLNLTAMMDVMTILLVYLIKVYASSPENITLNDDLRPPASTAPDNVVPAVKVMISSNAIIVDDRTVLLIKDGAVVYEEKTQKYKPLAKALEKRRDDIKAISQRTGGPGFDGILMVVADENTSYGLLTDVLAQAGIAQFTSYRLTVRHTGK